MQIVINIFITFFKIGAFSFGGGYAMISMIEREIVDINKWLAQSELIDIIGISQMTPGPIAINSSTFVGYKVAGFFGALAGTIGVILVSFVMITLLSKYVDKAMYASWFQGILKGIRPGVVGLILSAALSIGVKTIVDIKSAVLALFILYLIVRRKVHPILCIVIAAVCGMVFF